MKIKNTNGTPRGICMTYNLGIYIHIQTKTQETVN